ncbi:MAG: shikimate kinase [Thermoplasmata archaeon]
MITYGGLSIINAIPSGIGAVIPVDLQFNTIISPGPGILEEMDFRILKEIFNIESSQVHIEKKSQIPQGVGLKSSSAYTSSLIGEYFRYSGREVPMITIARLSSEISKKLGLSITGAFDDALASLSSGLVMTENSKYKVLMMQKVPKIKVIIAIPDFKRPKDIFERLRRVDSSEAIYYAFKGNFFRAAIINGYQVGKALGYPIEPLDRLIEIGSNMVGYSGNGPSLFASVNSDNIDRIREFMGTIGKVIETETRGG